MKLLYRPRALRDLIEIVEYIGQDDPLAAVNVRVRIEQSLLVLRQHPLIGRATDLPGLHQWSIPGLPYAAYYRVTKREIVIARVLHGRRKWPDALGR